MTSTRSAEAGGPVTSTHGYSANKDNYTKRLRRIEGQVRGIARMIDEEKYCIDILTQISAVNSALQSVALGLLTDHLNQCVSRAVAEGGKKPSGSWRRPQPPSPGWFVPDPPVPGRVARRCRLFSAATVNTADQAVCAT